MLAAFALSELICFPHLLRAWASSPIVHLGLTSDTLSEREWLCTRLCWLSPCFCVYILEKKAGKNRIIVLTVWPSLFLMWVCIIVGPKMNLQQRETNVLICYIFFRNTTFQDEQLCSKSNRSEAMAWAERPRWRDKLRRIADSPTIQGKLPTFSHCDGLKYYRCTGLSNTTERVMLWHQFSICGVK